MDHEGKVALPEMKKKRKLKDDEPGEEPEEEMLFSTPDSEGRPAFMRKDPNLETPEYLAAGIKLWLTVESGTILLEKLKFSKPNVWSWSSGICLYKE